ncbi:MAG: bifunctional riboflavin kinase/FAD synthetase [Geodermatophilaceae bacterium]|nr:bifunctional riboflavin kinase/FAD synthetase [Geodermatophilaceae bacterium]
MMRWRGVDATPSGWGRSVVTIGMYDGVHRGHQQIIRAAVDEAHALGLAAVVVSFDPHPSEVVRPGTHPPILTAPARKAELIESLGADALCVLPFTLELSRVPADEFVHQVLVQRLHVAAVVVGANFRFGNKASGDVAMLSTLGRRFGFTATGVELLAEDGVELSSTYVRACVAAGDMPRAERGLGRPHRIDGVVVRGDQRGRQLGYPTANVESAAHTAIPADGVYAGRLVRAGTPHTAAISVGSNPTFSGEQRRVEAFVLDFDGDLYGEHVSVEFVERLRPMVKFDSVDALLVEMANDVERTRARLS